MPLYKRKYIFESRSTRIIRRSKNTIVAFTGLALCYASFCYILILTSVSETKKSSDVFYKKPPGLIAVFTGDSGRIPFALKKAKEFNQFNILVTGVYAKNTVETFLSTKDPESFEMAAKFEIDYYARNTVENVIATLRYLRKSGEMSRVLIISHDYHIARIKLLVSFLREDKDSDRFHFMGIKKEYNNFRDIKILSKEVIKFVRTLGFLILWDKEDIPTMI